MIPFVHSLIECAGKLLNWVDKVLYLLHIHFEHFRQGTSFFVKHIKRSIEQKLLNFIL